VEDAAADDEAAEPDLPLIASLDDVDAEIILIGLAMMPPKVYSSVMG
jgi:hypothetical protein